MCGLVGVVGNNLTKQNIETFKWLLHFDTVRGEDSTGVAFGSKRLSDQKRKVTLVKTEGHPSSLYQKFPEVFSARGDFQEETRFAYNFFMGHNRAATIGKIDATNAHPFHHGNVTGAHNGTVRVGLEKLPTGEEIQGQTDSEKLIYALSKNLDLQTIVNKVRGAIAMTWYDEEANTFNLYRNEDRSLHYWMNPGKTLLVYASEAWMIRRALERVKYVAAVETIPVKDHEKITLSLNGHTLTTSSSEVKAPLPPPVVNNYLPPSGSHYGYGHGGYGAGNHKLHRPKVPNYLRVVGENEPPPKENSLVMVVKNQTGWLKLEDLDRNAFRQAARYGCIACSCDLLFEDHINGNVKWIDKETPICVNCSEKWTESETKIG